MATVELRDIITASDQAAVLAIRRGPGQDRFKWGEAVLRLDIQVFPS